MMKKEWENIFDLFAADKVVIDSFLFKKKQQKAYTITSYK